MSCKRSQEFLTTNSITEDERVIANKIRFGPDEALSMARAAAHVYVAKGKKVVHFDMRADSPSDEALQKILLGRSGTLRAPAIKSGDRFLVGFNAEMFSDLLT